MAPAAPGRSSVRLPNRSTDDESVEVRKWGKLLVWLPNWGQLYSRSVKTRNNPSIFRNFKRDAGTCLVIRLWSGSSIYSIVCL